MSAGSNPATHTIRKGEQSMLNVYIGDIKSENLVKFNDAWFDRHLKGLKVDANIKYFMKKIDEFTYTKEHKMYFCFDKVSIWHTLNKKTTKDKDFNLYNNTLAQTYL